ncbi:hypothetical protein MSAN_01970400 [Mycena sanguinolenta]|uniref:Uncharacterized protein n=1 Tax=Mycena sanguinolenta TaxID=230812 RepID=A0A8H6XM06_9AGAR|nr:hypothetical protein MSAN_01970400 [Mycena sanguinolenta]
MPSHVALPEICSNVICSLDTVMPRKSDESEVDPPHIFSLHLTFMKRILRAVKSFRLGYTEDRPYPWRWTTPIVLCAFFLISPFLALLNVPLSAYNIVQEFTYWPNGTLPSIFLGGLIPSILQDPTDTGFTPQLLSIGDKIALDNYIYNYTIAQAFNGVNTTTPVSAFPYYNNPLSDGCDAAIQLALVQDTDKAWDITVQVSGNVACNIPSLFYLTWSGFSGEPPPQTSATDAELPIRNLPFLMTSDLESIFLASMSGLEFINFTQAHISLTVHPCCDCDAILSGSPLESGAALLQRPCSSSPPEFVVVAAEAMFGPDPGGLSYWPGPLPKRVTDVLSISGLGNISFSDVGNGYENLIQSIYHLVRLDLGVILENQIYNSPEMFNRTIIAVGEYSLWASSTKQNFASDATLKAQWLNDVEFYQTNERVPRLEYFRSVSRLKPLASAVTSVFVSTFAMLSVMWTVFSLVLAALARSHITPNNTQGKKHTLEQPRKWDKWLERGMEEVDGSEVILISPHKDPEAVERLMQEGVRTRIALARINAVLKKHGLMEEEDWVQDDETTGRWIE